jgi:hypothetical protein
LHVKEQALAVHAGMALGTVAHARPHAPQLLGSPARNTQEVPQTLEPAVHVEQAPAVQIWLVRHGLPQAPQFFRSVLAATSQPFVDTPSQSR